MYYRCKAHFNKLELIVVVYNGIEDMVIMMTLQVMMRIVMTNSSVRQQTWSRGERRVTTYSQECCITGVL